MTTTLCLGPIPEHLRKFEWYAPHQEWLRKISYAHHDPEGATAARANLLDADLSGDDLSDACMVGAYMGGANLIGSRLRGANMVHACMFGAKLSGADLGGARLIGAELHGADPSCADITHATHYQCRVIGDYLQYGCECHHLDDWTPDLQSKLCELHDESAASDLAECVRQAKEIVAGREVRS